MTNKEKFLALVSHDETKTVERAKARLAKKSYTKISNQIAFEILERLDELKWKQKYLAEKMGVSPQQVSKWVKGNENFTLETLVNLGAILGMNLIQIPTQATQRVNESFQKILSEEYIVFSNIDQLRPQITMSDDMEYENSYQTA